MTVGNAVIKLGYLMEKVMIGSGNNRGQMSVIYNQEQSGCNYCNEQQGQSGSQEVLTCRELWQWLIEYGVPRSKIGGNPTSSFLHYTTEKKHNKSRCSERAAPPIIIFCPISSPEPILISNTKVSRKPCNASSNPSLMRGKTTYLSNCTLEKRESHVF